MNTCTCLEAVPCWCYHPLSECPKGLHLFGGPSVRWSHWQSHAAAEVGLNLRPTLLVRNMEYACPEAEA